MDEPVGDDDLWVPDKLRAVGGWRNGGGTDAPTDWLPEGETSETPVERDAAHAAERAQEVESLLRDAELRIERLEASLGKSETERRRLERALRAANERAAAGAGGRDEAGRLELNSASVEGLRGLGLSITQAARLVANREARGGFASLEELDAVPGLPAEQRAELRERAYVDASTA
jgi:DNA uptake protein ComE-like DNA-binding protein